MCRHRAPSIPTASDIRGRTGPRSGCPILITADVADCANSPVDAHTRAHRARDRDLLAGRCPSTPAGLALLTASTSAARFSLQLLHRERRTADRALHDAGLVGAVLHLAGLGVLHRAAPRPASPCRPSGSASGPRGPRIWPSWPTTRIASGVAITTSKSILPPLICVGQVVETDDVGAGVLAPAAPCRPARTPPRARSCRCPRAAPPSRARSGRISSRRCRG